MEQGIHELNHLQGGQPLSGNAANYEQSSTKAEECQEEHHGICHQQYNAQSQ